MEITLKLISGICWSLVYIILILDGFKHKTYGMPLFALGLNFAWETIYSFYLFDIKHISLQRGINIFWFLLDIIILYQFFRFGKKYFPSIHKIQFVTWSIIVLVSCFIIEGLFLMEFGRSNGAKYAAFLQNLLMSILFIDMFFKRTKNHPVSLKVAIFKWVGTLAPTILFGLDNSFILIIGLLCSLFDIYYITILIYYKGTLHQKTMPKP